jgi:hypothetical protein
MQTKITNLLAASLLIACAPAASAATSIGLLTFEANVPGFFSFAENAPSISTIQIAPGVGGTDGIATRVLSDPGSYAGGGIGDATNPFNLSAAGIVGGAVTVADFNNLRGSFDVNLPIGKAISIRLEPGNGGYNERVDLGVTVNGTGAFQNVSFSAALAPSTAQKTTFVNTLNSTSATGLKFVFQIDNQAASVGSDFVFDNLELNVVPEPSAAMLAALCGTVLSLRRRRR